MQSATTVRRDLALAAAVIAVSAISSVHFEVSEAVQGWAQRWEHYQLDEFPGIALTAALALAWFVWRRVREVRAELGRRIAAERRLAAALEDNRRLAQCNVRAQEAERRRLARELHDEFGQHLNAIKIEAVSIRRAAQDETVRQGAASIVGSADHLHAIVRDMTRTLRPPGLDELGLAAALEHHIESWRDKSQVEVALETGGDLGALPEELNITVYRVVQEALTNVARHASARRVRIRVERASDAVQVALSDDGGGSRAPWASEGVGLIGMRERVEALGGIMHVATEPGRGFTVRARLPLACVSA